MNLDMQNVLMYIDNAVRYETLADDLAAPGPTCKTIAASTRTPTSFGSLLTGLYPPAAGVLSFQT